MGFLSKLFGGEPSPEQQLIEVYAQANQAMGFSRREAVDQARGLIEDAKRAVVELGWDKEGPNRGTQILEAAKTDPTWAKWVELRHKEGVRDADILWWWNTTPLDRMAILKSDEQARMAAFIPLLKNGMEPADAAKRVKQLHPIFGQPDETSDDDNRPLPVELKERITSFVERHFAKPDEFKARVEASPSFNALVRESIRAGNL